jgi:AcrR family transcriptional regulator
MTPLSSTMGGMSPQDEVDDRRRRVLEVAARLLAEEGPQGLSLRRVAAESGGSTQLIYTLFGGKPGLANALYGEGFRRLGAAMGAALESSPPPGDPERLVALGRAYRAFALAEPAFFSVMFGRAIPGFTPERANRGIGRALTLGRVVQAAQECLDAGTLVGTDAEELARTCWVTTHGLASLEVNSMLAEQGREAFAEVVLRAPIAAHRPPG